MLLLEHDWHLLGGSVKKEKKVIERFLVLRIAELLLALATICKLRGGRGVEQ